ncbi:MAG TPA: electron transporter RnfE [Firmicutes bacterium]|jgi:electron transport complex protein RnfE|nr:electron transporter RnfE [Bacillota bacterium]
MKKLNIILEGIVKNNSTFVLLLGLCSILASSSTFSSAVGMGVAVIIVLITTNIIISSIRKITPNDIRIPVFIVVIASVVSIIQMLMKAYTPELAMTLGVYLPLIVVNCIIMARAEVYASKNNVFDSFLDAIGIGIGYFLSIVALSLFREILSTGALKFIDPFTNSTVFDIRIFNADYAIGLFSQSAGAFLMLGLMLASINAIQSSVSNRKLRKAEAAKAVK